MKALILSVLLLLSGSLISGGGLSDEINITTKSEEAKRLYITARDLSEKMEFAKAILLINRALKIDPEFALAYLLKARQTSDFNDQEYNLHKAEKYSQRISEGEKYLIHYYNGVFSANFVMQKKYLEKLLEIYPGDKRIQMLAAGDNYLNGDYEKAMEHLIKVIEIDPFYYPAYNLLGYCKAGLDGGEQQNSLQDFFTCKGQVSYFSLL